MSADCDAIEHYTSLVNLDTRCEVQVFPIGETVATSFEDAEVEFTPDYVIVTVTEDYKSVYHFPTRNVTEVRQIWWDDDEPSSHTLGDWPDDE